MLTALDLRASLQLFLAERLPNAACTLVDTARSGATSVFFSVALLEHAASLVSARHALKGSGFTLMEVLCPEEEAQHQRLWPAYLAARAAHQRAQFTRARLRIDGVLVP